MENVVIFYDAIDEATGKRYLGRFRKYSEDHGTKKQKADDVVTFVFERFEAPRENRLPIHDIDLKRLAL
ncbi:unnamed protein product [Adineta ricciae]|uniref:Uncharacterized protein n=1 Tax=Adineta ricciae TaxID=249248 RepID=A0A815ERL3_ADIRI|nr:unnamed protein product [Adineta ricciae]CAF1600458.1 unnamed protein product [Adineta ricciae]